MAKVANGVEPLPKISIAWVGWTNVTDRQTTDRRTDGRYKNVRNAFTRDYTVGLHAYLAVCRPTLTVNVTIPVRYSEGPRFRTYAIVTLTLTLTL